MDSPDDLSLWSLHGYCLGARETPHATVRQGDNGRLLFAAEDWCGPEDLARLGLSPRPEQIERLVDFGLIERQGEALRSLVPRLGPALALPLRQALAPVAATFFSAQAGRIAAITRLLAARGMEGSLYAYLFGAVLDGTLWNALKARVEIPETRLTPADRWWRGVFWAVYPPVPGAIGTNEITLDETTMTLVWSAATAQSQRALRQQDWPRALLLFLEGEAPAAPAEAVAAGLVDAAGRPAVPLLGSPDFALLETHGNALAQAAADDFVAALDRLPATPAFTAPQRHVILAHEFLWALQGAYRPDGEQVAAPSTLRASVILHRHATG